jgi:PAS domain S-box-containing protein
VSRLKDGSLALRLLLIEAERGEFLLAAIRRHGFEPDGEGVSDADALRAALEDDRWSAVIARFDLAALSASDALKIVRSRNPDLPFIVICDPADQARALELVLDGANDIVTSDGLLRLGPALERELRNVHLREENRSLFNALRRADTRYRRIFEKAPIGVAISTPTGTIVTVNERFLAIFGYTRDELVGMQVWQLAHPDERPPTTLPSSSYSTRYTLRYVRKDQSTVWANVTVSAIAGSDGIVEQLVWLIEDTTAHHVAEEQVALQSLLLDSVGQAVIATDLHGAVLYSNRYAETLYGWSTDEIFGRSISELTVPPESSALAATILEQLREGRSWAGEIVLRRSDGTTFPAFIIDAPILDANGNLAGIVRVSNDITERKKAEEDLRSSREQLAVAQRIARIGSWEYDLVTGQGIWSDELARIYGYEPAEVRDLRDIAARVHPDERARMAEFRRDILEKREPFTWHHRIVLPDGRVRYVHSHGNYVFDEHGKAVKVTGVVQDVTGAHEQELELAQRAVQQAAVANLGQAALSGASVERLIGFAISIVTEYLGTELCSVLEAYAEGFRIAGSTEGFLDDASFARQVPTQAVYALQTRVPLVASDLPSDTRFVPSPMLLELGIVSGITVPIIGGNAEPWGVLQAFSTTHREFTTNDVDFVRTVATVLGQAIMRSRADEELRVRARQQSAIAELSRVALRTVAQELYDTASALARERLGLEEAAMLIDPMRPRPEDGWNVEIPIASSYKTFGALCARTQRGRALADTEMDFLQTLANIVADALERERSASALAASEQRHREVVEGATEVIFTLSLDGVFLTLNAAFESVTGWRAADWVGKPYLHLIHPEDREHSRNVFRRLIEERRSIVDELRLVTARGERTVEVTSFAKLENGVPEAIYGFVRDVTTERRAERDRQQLTRNLQLLLESTVEGILTFDLEDRCTMSNAAASRFLGRTSEEMVQLTSRELLHGGKNRDEFTMQVANSGRVRSESNAIFYRKDGTSVPVDYSAAPVIDEGVVIGVVVSFSEITERLQLEAKLEQANRVASLGRLAATVAHEFNNVLMGISPFIEVIRRGRDVERAVEHISRTIKRGKRITEDILRFTQPAEPVRTAFDVRTWLQNLLFEARLVLPRNISVTLDEVDPSMRLHGDANQLQQVFTNLILNARDAMPDGGTLTLAVKREAPNARFAFGPVEHPERFAHFVVNDTGVGMGRETLKHIFEPLFTTKRSGTGLGLPVAHQVVLRHAGEMFVESEIGSGTSFHIFLPLAFEEVSSAPESAPALDDTPQSLWVLLVEDDESVAAGLVALLGLEGFRVTCAATGQEAIDAIRVSAPDVVVLDVGLPDMDGTSVYNTIAAIRPDLPVIFSTGHGDRARVESFLENPHVAFLLKPYDGSTLLQTIREVTNVSAPKPA